MHREDEKNYQKGKVSFPSRK